MISELKPYSEYVDSGVHWLGKTPKHWSVLPNRALFDEVKDRNLPGEEMLSVTIKQGVIRQKALLDGSSKKDSSNLDRSKYKLVRPGHIAYNKMRAWQGAIGVSDFKGIVSPAYVVVRSRDQSNLPRFFHHLFRTPQFAKEAERWSYGITSDMWSLRPEHFRLIFSPQPPPDEQAAIVKFLDWANGRIDRAIRAKRKVIALLNEQKQVIIHRAVTRGIDPNVELKPSRLPWLGEIPRHWNIRKLGQLVHVFNGSTPSRTRLDYWTNGRHPWLSSSKVNDPLVSEPTEYISDAALAGTSLTLAPKGSLIIGLVGQGKTRGTATMLGIDAYISQNIAALVKKEDISMEYLLFALKGLYSNIRELGRGGNQEALNCEIVSSFRLPLPPKTEQETILREVAESTKGIQILAEKAHREIQLLSEYRSRLVADVVTGKLDVTVAAKSLSAEIETAVAETDVVADLDIEDETEIMEEQA